jgi:hypothetical protein
MTDEVTTLMYESVESLFEIVKRLDEKLEKVSKCVVLLGVDKIKQSIEDIEKEEEETPIDEEDIESLKRRSRFLAFLECEGVKSWSGYDYARKMMEDV